MGLYGNVSKPWTNFNIISSSTNELPALVIYPFFKVNEEHFTFTYSTNILVSFPTVNMKNFLTLEIRKCATPFW